MFIMKKFDTTTTARAIVTTPTTHTTATTRVPGKYDARGRRGCCGSYSAGAYE